ncbi:MAG TPA: AAA family ATPase [Acetobacteraceae bacterium]|nr:AAA family ATPase [Acetobacteraceae bacterium]
MLFGDLVDSVAMSTRVDPEVLRPVMSEYHWRCATVIERHGGFVAHYLGDGILAYFGYPKADESDADRAVRAGLALVREVGQLALNGAPLRARVGIATGQVVVGDLIGRGASLQRGVVGVTPNLAARLQGVARPNTVVIGAATRRLVGGSFIYSDLGQVALRGFDESVPAWEVVGESTVDSRFEARAGGTLTPLVGRHEQLAVLQSRWEQARSGDGQVVLISGEPGVGKSRIITEFEQRLSDDPHARLRCFCSPHRQDTALHPFIAQITRAAALTPEDAPRTHLQKLETLFAPLTDKSDEDVAVIADLLSIPTQGYYAPLTLPPRRRKERTLDVLLTYLGGLASREPVLAICEDFHWADPTSHELLDLIIPFVRDRRVLMLVTHRPDLEVSELVQDQHVTRVSLDRLNRIEGATLTTNVAAKDLPPEILQQIIDKSDGIPLFVEELTKAVLECGALIDAGDRYVLTGMSPSLAVPATLHDSLVARLDRLGSTREIAHIGAAIGRTFRHDLLAAVSQVTEEHLETSLLQLIRSELIFRRGMGSNTTYSFKHALVRDAAYASLLKEARRDLHARIAVAIETEFPVLAEKEPEELGRHYTEAGLPIQAIPHWRHAGYKAASRAAYVEAADHFRRALDLLSLLPSDMQRHQIELDLRCQLGLSLLASRGYAFPEVQISYDRARQLCQILGNPTELFGVLRGLWSYYYVRDDLATAHTLSEECVRLGAVANSPMYLIEGYTLQGYTLVARGQFAAGKASLEQALAMYEAHDGHKFQYATPDDPGVSSLGMLALVAWAVGDVARSQGLSARAVRLAQQLDHPFNLATAYTFAAAFECHRGRPSIAMQHATESIKIAREHGFDLWIASASLHLALAKAALGEAAEAIVLFQAMLQVWQNAGAEINRSFFLVGLAKAFRKAGHLSDALAVAEQSILHVERYQELAMLSPVYLLRGELRLLAGTKPVEGLDDMLRALAIAREQGAKMYEVRALLSLREWDADGNTYDDDLRPLEHLIAEAGHSF